MKDILESVKVIDPEGMMHTLSVEALDLSYRHSCIMEKGGIVVEATIKLEKRGNAIGKALFVHLHVERSLSFSVTVDTKSHECSSRTILAGILQQLPIRNCWQGNNG